MFKIFFAGGFYAGVLYQNSYKIENISTPSEILDKCVQMGKEFINNPIDKRR